MRRLLPLLVPVLAGLVGCAPERGVLLVLSVGPELEDGYDALCLVVVAGREVRFSRRYEASELVLPASVAVVAAEGGPDEALAVAVARRWGRPVGRARGLLRLTGDRPRVELGVNACVPLEPTSGFAVQSLGSPSTAPGAAAAADLDGDGLDEVLDLAGGGPLAILAPGLDPEVLDWTAGRAPGGTVLGADLDLDCAPDVVVADSGGVLVGLSSGFGPLEPAPEGAAPATSAPVAALCDVDADGAADLVVVAGDRLEVHRGDRTGGFEDEPSALALGFVPRALGCGDLNGDGAEDVLAVGAAGGRALGLGVAGSGRLVEDSRALPAGDEDLGAVALGDFDGDGLTDAAVGGAAGLALWRWAGSELVEATEALLPGPVRLAVRALVSGDADADCGTDLLVLLEGGPTLLLVSRSGLLAEGWVDLPEAHAAALLEATGDGRPDIFLAGPAGRLLAVGRGGGR